jgi:GAF domain-containing protein
MPQADSSEIDLAQAFGDMARELLAEHGVDETLHAITRLAVETVPGCDHAAISLVEGRSITTRGSSDDVGLRVDAIQYDTDEGPCLESIRTHEMFIVADLATEERWPKFAHRAAQETGVRSMLSFRLFAEADTLGALNLYSRAPDAFTDEAFKIGAVFAAHAAVAMVGARHDEQFAVALQSRDIIGQAKGIIMATSHVDSDDAFELLRTMSQDLNEKLRDVAKRVTETGMPDVQPGPHP